MFSASLIFIIFGIFGVGYSYDLGVRYSYKYHTHVASAEGCQNNEKSQLKDIRFRLKATVHVTSIWENELNKEEKLLKIELINPSLLVPKKLDYEVHNSKLDSFSQSPLLVEWVDGEVRTVFGDSQEHHTLKNLKKAIASLLQIHVSPSPITQRDVSGDCLVKTEVNGRIIKKKKENCSHPEQGKYSFSSLETRSGKITSSSETTVELVAEKSKFVLSAEGQDYFQMYSNLWKQSTVCVHSKTSLSLESEHSGASTVSGKKSLNEAAETSFTLSKDRFKKENLYADLVPKKCENSCKDLPKLVSGYRENLETKNLAKLKSASTFLKLLDVFRLSSKEDIVEVVKNKKFKTILPQLLDVIAHTEGRSSLHPAIEALELISGNSDHAERLLLSLCTSSHPDVGVLQNILALLKKDREPKVQATLIVSLASILRTLTANSGGQLNEKVVQDVQNYFVKELKSCKLVECQIMYLRGLRNAALPSSVPVLLEYAEKGGNLAIEALLALKNVGSQEFDFKAVEVFQRIFHQTKEKQTSTSRALAAELLLMKKPEEETIQTILDELRKPEKPEFRTFVLSKIYNIVETDKKLRSEVKEYLINEDLRYHITGQKGASVSFTKPLITTAGANATYGVEMEMVSAGNVKRSLFDVNISTPKHNLQVLSVGIYSEGMSSLGGTSESDDSDDKVEATAGMELTLLGVSLRPYVFFKGSSQLFSHVWNGVGSEPTPALQGNFLLIDDSTAVILQNGFVVDFSLKGVLSIDLSAHIEISMWYKTSKSTVNNAAALLVKGSAHIDASFVNTFREFSFMGESKIEFITDLDFADAPFKMCLQMQQPGFPFRYNVLTTTGIPDSKYRVKVNKKRKLFVPPQSFSLHRDNHEQCASLIISDS